MSKEKGKKNNKRKVEDDKKPTKQDKKSHHIFNTYVQSFRKGFSDGGSINIQSCCKQHSIPGTLSDWNKEPQRTMEQDWEYWYVCKQCGKENEKESNNATPEIKNGLCDKCFQPT